jgi:DNA-binding NtrC family response regulator
MTTGHRNPPTEPGAPSNVAMSAHRVEQLRLVFSPSPVAGGTVTLSEGPVVVGREPQGNRVLRLDDAQVSRSHARVERHGDGWRIVDVGARNGIYVDGARTPAAPLRHGTVVRIGRSLLVFVQAAVPDGARLEPETSSLAGQSAAMQMVRGDIAAVAPSDLPVLIVGETGVGKERAAEEVHRLSGRRGPFVAVNCAAIPENLAESELFGHAAGAFTGAIQRTEGLFVAAEGGTLFLDEVGELPTSVQPKLLRALAGREVRAVGRAEARIVDVRVVAATHRALSEPAFRADLYARLAGWTVAIAPLRERRDDVLRLAHRSLQASGSCVTLSAGAAEALCLYDWPRNVRQLEQVIAAATVRAHAEGVIRPAHLPEEIGRPLTARAGETVRAEPPLELLVSRDSIPGETELRVVIERLGGNLARVATYFGKDRRQIYRWIERLGIDVGAYRDDEASLGEEESG